VLPITRYTKHYFAGTQRINGALGSSENIGVFNCDWLITPMGNGAPPINEKDVALQKAQAAAAHGNTILQQLGINGVTYGQGGGYTGNCTTDFSGPEETDVYWYHSDHLGSTSFVTGIDGEVNQNIEYFPSGETFVENHLNSYNTPYKFNSKELDDETGYYYYGARYYNPRVSLWLNVDPLASYDPIMNAEHYIDGQHNAGIYNSGNLNPYIYTYNSPIVYIDPNGKQAKVTDVALVNITVGYEYKHNRYYYKVVSTDEVTRFKGVNWIGKTEYRYTIYAKNSKTPRVISSQDLKDGQQYELPGIINQTYNPYNLDAYQGSKKIANLFKLGSDASGKTTSFIELYGSNKNSKALGIFSLIMQGAGTAMDVINEMSIGERREALNILTNDTFDTIVGSILTNYKLGKIYDVIGKPEYEKGKEALKKELEKSVNKK